MSHNFSATMEVGRIIGLIVDDITRIMDERNLSVEIVAIAARMSTHAMRGVLGGSVNVTIGDLARIADALGFQLHLTLRPA